MARMETVSIPSNRPLSGKMIRNVAFGGLRSLLVLPVPFLLTPLILREIGTAGYGTWAVFLAINGMTSLADLGLVGALSKFVAEHHVRRDHLALSRLLNTSLVVFGILSLALVSILWVGTPLLVALLFRGSSIPIPALAILFRYFLVVVGANVFILLFSSVTTGLQRLDLTNIMSAFNTLCAAAVGALLLLRGWGLRGLLCGQVCAVVLTLMAYFLLVRRLLPQVKWNPSRFDAREARHIFSFSLRLYFTQVAVAVHNNIEKLLLAFFVGVSAAGWYDIANEVALRIRGTVGLVLSPVMPAASELGTLRDGRRLEELYYRAHKYLAFIGVPTVCFVAVVSARFMDLWIGPSLGIVALPLSVLVFANFLNLVTGPGFLIFAGNGNLGPGMRSAALGIALNVLVSFLLIRQFGLTGAVAGTLIALGIASFYFMYLFHKETGHLVGRLLRESYLRPTMWSIALAVGMFLFCPASGVSWVSLGIQGLLFGAIYALGLLFSRFFDEYDWSKFESVAPMIRHARRIVPIA